MLQELLLKVLYPFCSHVWGQENSWCCFAVFLSLEHGLSLKSVWRPAPLWQGRSLSHREEHWLQKAGRRERTEPRGVGVGGDRALHRPAGIKACLCCVPRPFCEHRLETGGFVLHKLKAHGSMIPTVRFQMKFILVEKEMHLASLPCHNAGQDNGDSSDAFNILNVFVGFGGAGFAHYSIEQQLKLSIGTFQHWESADKTMINTEYLADQRVIMNSKWDIKDRKQPGRWPVSWAQVLQLRTSLETLLSFRVRLPTAVVLCDSVGLNIDLVWGLGRSLEIFLRVLFDLDGGAHGKGHYASSLPEVQAIRQQIFISECLSCFCDWPDLVLVAIWNTKKCVIPAQEELNPVGEIPKHRQTWGKNSSNMVKRLD